MKQSQEIVRMRVYKFYLENVHKGKSYTVNHFLAEKIPRSTIYRVLQHADYESGWKRKPGSGRKAVKMPQKQVKALCKMFDNHDKVTYAKASRRFNISRSYAQKIIANKSMIKKRRKTKIPARTPNQRATSRAKCGRLYRNFNNCDWIIDDESYFSLSASHINGNRNFYTSDVEQCPASVETYRKAKYEDKVLVWVAFSVKGFSKILIRPSGFGINGNIYLSECIKKRIMPFIEEHYKTTPYVFWPDLATPHYAKIVTDYLIEKKVNFVPKRDNPANLPEARPIEDFWSIIKGMVYKDDWVAENVKQLRNRILYCFGKVDMDLVRRLAESVRSRLDKIRRHDLIENQ